MQKRARQCANPNVRESDYVEAIKDFVGKHEISELLGPLSNKLHKLTPHAVVRASKLLELLVDRGVGNGVLYSTRFECAVKATCMAPRGRDVDAWSAEVTDHLRLCFGMVRQIILDNETRCGVQRSRKSSAFKRQCSGTDLVVIHSLMQKLTLASDDKSRAGNDKSDAENGNSGAGNDNSGAGNDNSGAGTDNSADDLSEFRDIFKGAREIADDIDVLSSDDLRGLFRTGQRALDELGILDSDSDHCPISDCASTQHYPEGPMFDKDGFPVVRSTAPSMASTPRGEATTTPNPPLGDATSNDACIPDPSSARRRRKMLESRAMATPKKKCVMESRAMPTPKKK